MELSEIIVELQRRRAEVNSEIAAIADRLKELIALNELAEKLKEKSMSLDLAITRLQLVQNDDLEHVTEKQKVVDPSQVWGEALNE